MDRLEAISVPSTSISKGIKNKKIGAGNPPAHPRQLKKIIGDRLAKRIFVTKNALCRISRATESTFESRFVETGPCFDPHGHADRPKMSGEPAKMLSKRV